MCKNGIRRTRCIRSVSYTHLGTSEVTRRGMKEEHMEIIAEFFKRVIIDREEIEKVSREIEEFNRQFLGIEYSF